MNKEQPVSWDAPFPWDVPIRTDRLAHTHIFQTMDLIEECPACGQINPMHMTTSYARKAKYTGGWA